MGLNVNDIVGGNLKVYNYKILKRGQLKIVTICGEGNCLTLSPETLFYIGNCHAISRWWTVTIHSAWTLDK